MSLQDVDIKAEYRTLANNIAQDFYIPLLRNANSYKRAVGFFSSTALVQISKGLCDFVKNGGKIQLVASPYLSEADIEAIKTGYKLREQVIEDALFRQLQTNGNIYEEERLNLLANLIAENQLDIKIAFTENRNSLGMYHEKMGIISDASGNELAFAGSMNESETAMMINYESIDVFCSWKSKYEYEKVKTKMNAFEAIWNDCEPKIKIMEFPKLKDEFIKKYKRNKPDFELDKKEFERTKEKEILGASIPANVELHDYQKEAVENWKENNYRGIFDMATGTGKTYTGLAAIAKLCESVDKLAVFIVCPYQHLVEQWVEDIKAFNMNPIIGHSGSAQKDYKKRLTDAVFNYQIGVKKFFCFVCTNATFASESIQKEVRQIKGNALLVVDEAHNFGAENLSKSLTDIFQYRLALSATLERHNDENGTNVLRKYFGDKCIEYTLERAIAEKKLTNYYYHPVVVSLSEIELENYKQLTMEIGKCVVKKKNGKIGLNPKGEKLLLKRARLIAGAVEKIDKLYELMQDYVNDHNMLIYCGATRLVEQSFKDIDVNEDIRQIDYISRMLNNKLEMTTAQFTSRENSDERKLRIEMFLDEDIQALVAIKCLDEGVNIPKIRTAFILASTTNPKEYIQRRGRVLRLAKEKEYAVIYDFITLPRAIDSVMQATQEEIQKEKSLVKNELRRMLEFKRLALNMYDSDKIIEEIVDAYELYEIDQDDKDDNQQSSDWEEEAWKI